jgi:EAL domain-containing protein (putative c-di-GMP-specific phosphodiesterase class I)/DNA-binding response OmpR family regulator
LADGTPHGILKGESIVNDPAAGCVLVVDDDPAIVRLMALSLRRAGFEAIEAASGAEALRIIERQKVAIVVSDMGMPGMSGLEIVHELRRRPETATLPIILVTGSGDGDSVIAGLDSGADDYLTKPVRMDELIARVRAHLRTQAAWSSVLHDELRVRAGVVAALGSLTASTDPEQIAETVVREVSRRTDCAFVSVTQATDQASLVVLASYNRQEGVRRGGEHVPADLAEYLLSRARTGPWVEKVQGRMKGPPTASFSNANLDLIAASPIFTGDDLVGLLSIGAVHDERWSTRNLEAKILAAAVDYASVLSAVAGHNLAGRRDAALVRAQLDAILDGRAFHAVVQPIIELETLAIVGYEALTRFDDGTPPDLRFAEATRAGLGAELELAAIDVAATDMHRLQSNVFVSFNISPRTLMNRTIDLRRILARIDRPIVLELTEHDQIEEYEELRTALRKLDPTVRIAVDDAGAGYASMRHILELQPAFAKLDISLVRGIDADKLRESLAAGLDYFALRTGCQLIAEGVETQAEADTLQRIGVEYAQGYLYRRPQPLADEATN